MLEQMLQDSKLHIELLLMESAAADAEFYEEEVFEFEFGFGYN